MFKNKRIGVLMGGTSREREISLRSGKNVMEALIRQGYDAISIDPARELAPQLKEQNIEVAFLALHGTPGEDGSIQGFLETLNIPYTGSKILASALAIDKVAAKKMFVADNVPTPPYIEIFAEDDLELKAQMINKKLGMPVVVKPNTEGSSFGVTIVQDKKDLVKVLEHTRAEFKHIFAEKFIKGQEVTVGILGSGTETEALPILELRPKSEFYDFNAKYTKGATEFILPAELTRKVYEKTQSIALAAHRSLGCSGVSRVDIIVDDRGRPWVHEINTIPGMTELSDLPAEALASGISFDQLVLKILASAQ